MVDFFDVVKLFYCPTAKNVPIIAYDSVLKGTTDTHMLKHQTYECICWGEFLWV